MVQNRVQTRIPSWLIMILGIPVIIGLSLIGIKEPLYLAALFVAAGICFVFFRYFEATVIGLLVLRSALDMFSDQQLPALFAVGVDGLIILFIAYRWITRQPIYADRFWWLLMGWIGLQGLWVVLLPLGGLGGEASALSGAIREWIRLFSGGMIYLLAMQLKERITPEKLVNLLFLCVAIPIAIAFLQILDLNGLPEFIISSPTEGLQEVSRIRGSMGHPNSFATFTLLFLALSLWKGEQAKRPIFWFSLAGLLVFLSLASKSLTGLVMLAVFMGAYFLPKLKGKNLFWALGIISILVLLFVANSSSSRLGELSATPLLHPDLTWSRAIALQSADVDAYRNSFNWRLTQWDGLIRQWRLHPWLGYGLATSSDISPFGSTAHNDYVRFLTEGGIVGLMMYILFQIAQMGRLVQLTQASLPRSPQQKLGMTLISLHISMLVGMLAGNVMVHTTMFFYWWTLLAVLGWSWSPPNPTEPIPRLPPPRLPQAYPGSSRRLR